MKSIFITTIIAAACSGLTMAGELKQAHPEMDKVTAGPSSISSQAYDRSGQAPAHSTTFYVSAHEDDWQLFMTPNAINDVKNATNKTVFIYTTAGDADCWPGGTPGTPNPPKDCPVMMRGPDLDKVPYYRVREIGALRSMRFIMSLDVSTSWNTSWKDGSSIVTVNGHQIVRWTYGRIVAYFMRLPDSYATLLAAFRSGVPPIGWDHSVTTLSALDGSTTYTSWNDLTATLKAIVTTEGAGSPTIWVNMADTDTSINPDDHADHIASAHAMLDALSTLPCVNQAHFTEYHKKDLPMNLPEDDIISQTGVFAVETSSLMEYGLSSTFPDHSKWLGRDYFRATKGTGTCSFTPSGDASDDQTGQK